MVSVKILSLASLDKAMPRDQCPGISVSDEWRTYSEFDFRHGEMRIFGRIAEITRRSELESGAVAAPFNLSYRRDRCLANGLSRVINLRDHASGLLRRFQLGYFGHML